MEWNSSQEANGFTASQEISHVLWNPTVHHRLYKCAPLVPYPGPDSLTLPTLFYAVSVVRGSFDIPIVLPIIR